VNAATQDTSRATNWFERPWYPFVIAGYPLWYLYLTNYGQVTVTSALAATGVFLAAVALMLWIAARLLRSRTVGAMVVTVFVAAFYAYGPLHDIYVRVDELKDLQATTNLLVKAFVRHEVFTAVMFGLCALLILLIVKRVSRESTRLTGACNFAAVALAVMLLARHGSVFWNDGVAEQGFEPNVTSQGSKVSVLGYNPDIYYIIVDGYARGDVFRTHYSFDNSEFLGGLGQRGFVINDQSRSNYNWTFLSLASSLNFAYLQDIAAPLFADVELLEARNGFDHVGRLAQDNRAAQFLRTRGYRFVHIRSSAQPTVRNPFADEEVACAFSIFDDEYFRALAEISWLKALGSLATLDLAECHKMRLEAVGDQAKAPGSKFVFAHFLPPHHPYLFDRHGNVLKHVTISNQFDFQARLWEDKHGYLEQVIYTNNSLLKLIDRIVAESARPPIIIVQSDHGPNLVGGLNGEQHRAVRFANFAAYLFPGATQGVMPRDTGPVNQFRYLFNHYFDADLPILPQRNFYSAYGTPLLLSEVESIAPIGN
jgi:hypothetical protein